MVDKEGSIENEKSISQHSNLTEINSKNNLKYIIKTGVKLNNDNRRIVYNEQDDMHNFKIQNN